MIYRIYLSVTVFVMTTNMPVASEKVPPSMPVFNNLKDIDGCKGCIVGEDLEGFSVLCKTSGGSLPISVTIAIENELLTPLKYDLEPGYMAFFVLTDEHHMKNITCTVMYRALTMPLKTTAPLYVIRKPKLKLLMAPETLHEGNDADIECIIDEARPSPDVYFNISGTKVLPSAHNISVDSANSEWINYFYLTTFKREWNQEDITCCIYNEWYMTNIECTEPKRVKFEFPPAYITLEIKTETTTPPQIYAVCTLYDSNPIYQVWFTATNVDLGPARYTRYYSIPHDAWEAEYAINLNVSQDNDKNKEVTCTAISPGLNESMMNLSSTVAVYSHDYGTKEMHWFYRWLIWTFLGIYFAASVVCLSVCFGKSKYKITKVISRRRNSGGAVAERRYANVVIEAYETLNDSTRTCGGSNAVNQLYESMNTSTCSGASNTGNQMHGPLNISTCTGGPFIVNEMYETLDNFTCTDQKKEENTLYENMKI